MPLSPPDYYGHFQDDGYASGSLSVLEQRSTSQRTPSSAYDMRSCGLNGNADGYIPYQPAHIARAPYCSDPLSQASSAYTTTATLQAGATQYVTAAKSQHYPYPAPDRKTKDLDQKTQPKVTAAVSKSKDDRVGGVAAHLDYDMDEMVDFVSEKAQRMYEFLASRICLADIDMTRSVLSSKSPPHQDFRKYVSVVLSSTRLPSSTILLGLLYLSNRVILLSRKGQYPQGARDVYSLLTISLVLGSKFLDDNTFQNRSWSEVSGMSVSELNYLEIQWLLDIKWDLHVDQRDPEGFQLWHGLWEQSKRRRFDLSVAETLRQSNMQDQIRQRQQQLRMMQQLPPLETHLLHSEANLGRQSQFASYAHGPWNTPQSVAWRLPQQQDNYSPPSAPETGPTTPDAYGLLNSFSYAPQPLQPAFKLPAAVRTLPSNVPTSGYVSPYFHHSGYDYSNHYEREFLTSQRDRHLFAPSYGVQSVVG